MKNPNVKKLIEYGVVTKGSLEKRGKGCKRDGLGTGDGIGGVMGRGSGA